MREGVNKQINSLSIRTSDNDIIDIDKKIESGNGIVANKQGGITTRIREATGEEKGMQLIVPSTKSLTKTIDSFL